MENNWKWYEENASHNTSGNGGNSSGNAPGSSYQQNAQYQPNMQGGSQPVTPPPYTPHKQAAPKRFSVGQLIACMLVMALLAGAVGAGVAVLASNGRQDEGDKTALNGDSSDPSIVTDESKLPDDNAQQDSDSASGDSNATFVPDGSASSGIINSSSGTTSDADNSTTAMLQSYMSSIVGIDNQAKVSTGGYWYGGGSENSSIDETVGTGSGVIITSDGYIATNNHVIEGADKLIVHLQDGTEFEAVLVGTDKVTDLAIIKIEAENLPAATLGASEGLEVGDTVYAVGNPLGVLTASVSQGIISGLDRLVTIDEQDMTLMQTDASVNPGNSGGGLFNDRGELIGIVNSKASGDDVDGIGFAIPIDAAKPILIDLMDLGFVSGRPYLGITMQDVYVQRSGGNQGYSFGYYSNYDVRVQVYSVEEGSAADKAGMKAGDVILTFDGKDVTGSTALSSIMFDYKIGDTVTVTVLRDSAQTDLSITLGERTK